eukprot:3541839-Pleurochrysis_carterae.AAC.5
MGVLTSGRLEREAKQVVALGAGPDPAEPPGKGATVGAVSALRVGQQPYGDDLVHPDVAAPRPAQRACGGRGEMSDESKRLHAMRRRMRHRQAGAQASSRRERNRNLRS